MGARRRRLIRESQLHVRTHYLESEPHTKPDSNVGRELESVVDTVVKPIVRRKLHVTLISSDTRERNHDALDLFGDVCIIPPNSFALARTVEYFRIPRKVLTICLGKSTYARCGIIVNVTPFEPEWEGFVTLEISNTTPLPAKIYANEGLAQVLFFEADEECEISYADKKGKYQKQQSIVLPKL